MNVSKIIEVPMFVSVVKLIYSEWIMCGHFDGNLSAWNFKTEEITPFKGHHADVLALDVNQVWILQLISILNLQATTFK